MADAGEHAPPLVLEPGPLTFEHVETFGQLVEGTGDVAELIAALDTSARRAVTRLQPSHRGFEALGVTPERSGGNGGEHRRQPRGGGEHPERRAGLVGVEHHQPGEHHRYHRADGDRRQRDGEHDLAQRRRPRGQGAQRQAGTDGAGSEHHHGDHRRQRAIADRVPDAEAHGSNR